MPSARVRKSAAKLRNICSGTRATESRTKKLPITSRSCLSNSRKIRQFDSHDPPLNNSSHLTSLPIVNRRVKAPCEGAMLKTKSAKASSLISTQQSSMGAKRDGRILEQTCKSSRESDLRPRSKEPNSNHARSTTSRKRKSASKFHLNTQSPVPDSDRVSGNC
ncbi:unnamed protein product [Protopolystoma xenopodis]|uniref:Uncharacterized protein n=1 Tax=Protopolystoma xenopodis TaxID=117903 RepID=A0A448WRI4_9PLAT|nr:unnamed protein product [Protopolystoma xenopodis]